MCGLAGFIDLSSERADENLRAIAGRMADTLQHRGPDDAGVWSDAKAGIAMGNRRLSIIDLSRGGHQPMATPDGRYVITYNGEVYNHRELRRNLEMRGRCFRGRSDTEVILLGCAEWGVTATVERLVGMFAFAFWDRERRTLSLVRDRLGIKPLYWGCIGTLFLFGSELKTLRAHPGWQPELDRDAVAAFMRHNYVPAPHSIYRGIRKLEPGHILTLRPGCEPELAAYWSMRAVAREGVATRLAIDPAEAIERLDALLREAISCRMVADVPLGVLLSGGIDSSTVAALMQAQNTSPVKSFSIGFEESGYDEGQHAKAVAAHLGTDHTELYLEPQHARDVIPRLPEMFDEPFADSSQIPTFLVSELARRDVTVALSGDGGDEVFAGYTRYFHVDRVRRGIESIPRPLRAGLATSLRGVSGSVLGQLLDALPAGVRGRLCRRRIGRAAELLSEEDRLGLYRQFISQWGDPDAMVLGATEPRGILWDQSTISEFPVFVQHMQLLDTVTYLPDDILTKVDRASMAASLEARVPLLDHRVVEFAWRLPLALKVRDHEGKWLLHRVLDRYVPRRLTDRPKMGFGVPIGEWLRGPLREWAEELLDEGRLRQGGVLNPALIRQRWSEHLTGYRDWRSPLWVVLMFQAWDNSQNRMATSHRFVQSA